MSALVAQASSVRARPAAPARRGPEPNRGAQHGRVSSVAGVECNRSRSQRRGDAQVARFWKGLGGSPASKGPGSDEATSSKSPSRPTPGQNLTPFPKDYAQMVTQCERALQAGLDDDLKLMEIQFPPGGLETAPGDVEGNMESNLTVQHLRGICTAFERNKTAKTTRVFFPDPTEAKLAKTGTSAGTTDGVRAPQNSETKAWFGPDNWPGPVDFLEDPSFLSMSGLDKVLNKRVTVAQRVKETETAFVVAYPVSNISELTCTYELYEGECIRGEAKSRPIVVCNGELERTRSNYYPPFWNAGEMAPLREFVKVFSQVYFIHNFKGSNPAVLFRCYPGPWQVLRRRRDAGLEVVWTGETYPGVQKVALEVLPKYP